MYLDIHAYSPPTNKQSTPRTTSSWQQQQQRDTHAVANGRKDVGLLLEGSNRCSHATTGKGEESWERACRVLGAGREACQDGQLQQLPRGTRAFEPVGIVLLAVHCRCVLLLRALLLWQPRHKPMFGRVVDFATKRTCCWLKTRIIWYLAREFAHTHIHLCGS